MFTLSGKTVYNGAVGNGVLFTLSGKTGLEWFGREWGLVHTVR